MTRQASDTELSEKIYSILFSRESRTEMDGSASADADRGGQSSVKYRRIKDNTHSKGDVAAAPVLGENGARALCTAA